MRRRSDRPALPPRVLLVCDYFLRYTAGLAAGLTASGAEVRLLARDHDGEFGHVPGSARVYVAGVAGAAVPHLALSGRVRSPRGAADAVRQGRVLRAWGPDVVHAQDSVVNDPRLVALALGLRRPLVLTVHDPVPHPGDLVPSRTKRALRRLLLRRADLVFVHGEVLREELVRTHDVRGPVRVVPHGSAPPVPAPLPGGAPVLLMFGRLSAYKGLDVLLDAMPLVWAENDAVRLVVAGPGREVTNPVAADPRVDVRVGHVPDAEVHTLFAAASLVVLPYRQASQSGVATLAREHGRGVLATRVGALAELEHAGGVRLVAPEDPVALARAIVGLVGEPEAAAALAGEAAASLAASAWPVVGRATLDAYAALASTSPARRRAKSSE